ncbi:MAG TPA: DUF2505 domain-containing protein [Pseudonocardia sp.]|jgi:hypothetical protein
MPRPIRYRASYPIPADELYTTLVSREFLQAKLDAVGGGNAALLDLASDADSAKYTLRQGVSREYLPGAVQKVLRGDLVIERSESLRKVADGRYEGSITARVKDAPGTISGSLLISAPDGVQGVFEVDGQVKVDIPLVGGKIESAVADQVLRLMGREADFAQRYLSG